MVAKGSIFFSSLIFVVLVILGAGGRTFAQTGEGIMVKFINVIGNENIESDVIIDLLTIKAGDFIGSNAYTVLERNADILERTGWFRERPILSYEGYEDGARLVIEVKEWPLFKEIRFTGNGLFSDDELLAAIDDLTASQEEEIFKDLPEDEAEEGDSFVTPEGVELPDIAEDEGASPSDEALWGGNPPLVKGEIISLKTLEWVLVDGVLAYYQDAGYIAAWVIDFNIELAGEDEGVITVELGEGYVEEILVGGFEKTKEKIIRREILEVKIGEPLKADDLRGDLRRLVNTRLFLEVNPKWEHSIKPGYIKVLFEVIEGKTGSFGLGAGYSTVGGVQGSLTYKEINLFGEAKSISSRLIFTQDAPGFEIEYYDPNVKSTDISFTATIFSLHERQQRNPGSVWESEIKRDWWGGRVRVGKKFTREITGTLAFGISDTSFDVIKGDPFVGFSEISRSRLMQEGETRSVTVAGYYDTRDNSLSSKEGNFLFLSAEIAGFGGDFDYRKYIQDYRHFFPIGNSTLGFRERIGFADGNLPIFEEFRLGGSYTIRGIDEFSLTGSKSLLFNAEYRHSIDAKDQFVVAIFSDFGWAGESFSDLESAKTVGIGIHFKIPQLGLGAIRLDYGWEIGGESRELLHFGIGEVF